MCVYEKESILFPVNGVDFSVSGELYCLITTVLGWKLFVVLFV